MTKVISILDYGAGNIHSVCHALTYLGLRYRLITAPEDVLNADCLVVPGQGAFVSAMERLKMVELDTAIISYINQEKPFLGICLGFQILFERSEEHGGSDGLGVFPGVFELFDDRCSPVPHMGWNNVHLSDHAIGLLSPYQHKAYVYFVHSYFLKHTYPHVIAATSDYVTHFVAAIQTERLLATQFHPEKSGEVGLALMANFFKKVL